MFPFINLLDLLFAVGYEIITYIYEVIDAGAFGGASFISWKTSDLRHNFLYNFSH